MDRKPRRRLGSQPVRGARQSTPSPAAHLRDTRDPIVDDDAAWPDDAADWLCNAEWFALFGHLLDEPADGHPVSLAPRTPQDASGHPSSSWMARAVQELIAADARADTKSPDLGTLLDHLQQTECLIAGLHALQSRLLVRVAGPTIRTQQHRTDTGATITISDPLRSEIAVAQRWTEAEADDRITVARLLERALPRTRSALAAGAISYRHAHAIADVVARHSCATDVLLGTAKEGVVAHFEADASVIEDRAVTIARRSGVSAARQAADRALRRRDAAHVRRRRERALRRRDVWLEVEPDGTALLLARMGLTQAHACLSAIDARARDPRLPLSADSTPTAGIGERRSEALVGCILGSTPSIESRPAESTPALEIRLDVTIDLATLLGLADGPASVRGSGPGGAAWTDVAEIRNLLSDSRSVTLRRLVTDPLTGRLLDRGRRSYRVTDALREFLIARDRTCRFPGCNRSAHLSQIDHAVPWDAGGSTDRANLGALCTRHHQLKTHDGWRIASSDLDGSCTWRSPAGRVLRHAPPAVAEPPHDTEPPSGGRDGPIPF